MSDELSLWTPMVHGTRYDGGIEVVRRENYDALRAENERLSADVQALLPAARLGIFALTAGHDMAVKLGLLEQIPGTHPSKARTWSEYRSCYRDTSAAISARAALAALDKEEAK